MYNLPVAFRIKGSGFINDIYKVDKIWNAMFQKDKHIHYYMIQRTIYSGLVR